MIDIQLLDSIYIYMYIVYIAFINTNNRKMPGFSISDADEPKVIGIYY